MNEWLVNAKATEEAWVVMATVDGIAKMFQNEL